MLLPFGELNKLQSMMCHTLYHSDRSVLLGAAPGNGKFCAALLAVLRALRQGAKVLYLAAIERHVDSALAFILLLLTVHGTASHHHLRRGRKPETQRARHKAHWRGWRWRRLGREGAEKERGAP